MFRAWFWGSSLFFAFVAYFSFTAYHLPSSAGPDEVLSIKAADFYYKYNKVATVAEDEDKMVFSPYGNTRLLRPPLGFYLPAAITKFTQAVPFLKELKLPKRFTFRLSNALLAASTVLLVFIALFMCFHNAYYATYGALSVGLIPQFGFYASYLNDDMSAIFTASLLSVAMVNLYKNDTSTKAYLFLAFAAGLTVLAKETAWIFVCPAVLFYFCFALKLDKYFIPRHVLMLAVFILAGGWWFIFNIYHYGVSDFMLFGPRQYLAEKYATNDIGVEGYGFMQKYGIGMKQLLLLNHADFYGATYKAFIGYLDWMRLKVGNVQYIFYLWVVLAVVLNFFCLVFETIQGYFHKKKLSFGVTTTSGFEWILYLAIAFQVLLYTKHNVYMDIQVQGKYLMPVIIPIIILAFRFIERWKDRITMNLGRLKIYLLVLVLFSTLFLVHLDALVDYIIPFYWPNLEISPLLSWL